MCIASRNLLIRAAAYETMRAWTVLPLHQNKTVKKEMKRRRMVRINNTPVDENVSRLNPDSSSGIYMSAVK